MSDPSEANKHVPPPGIGPLGLIAWAFRTVGRFAVLHARHARRGG